MKNKLFLLILTFILSSIFSFAILTNAEAAIETRNYAMQLGKYDPVTETFSPSNTYELQWNNMTVRTIGPWSIYVEGNRVGSIINFVDKNRPKDNGYPMVGDDHWDAWVDFFKGNKKYILGDPAKNIPGALTTWYVRTPIGQVRFANFSQLVELCGGRGVSYSIKDASSVYIRSNPPTSTLTPDKWSVQAGDTVTFSLQANSSTEFYQFIDANFSGAGTTYINKRYYSTSVNENFPVILNTVGKHVFTWAINDGVFRYSVKQATITVVPKNEPIPPAAPQLEPFVPEVLPEPYPNEPPVARFSWPSSAMEGDEVTVYESSVDYDGSIVDWDWDFSSYTGVNYSLSSGDGKVTFDNTGNYDLTLTVTDDDGATDTLTRSIQVTPAIPVAVINVSGTLKENRKIILSSINSKTSAKYPIDHARDEWTITPVSGGTSSDIKIGAKSGSTQEALIKKAGTYKVGLRVYNSKYTSEWSYTDIIVATDQQPNANFLVNLISYRNPSDSNRAIINLMDKSSSPDGDNIAQRIWKVAFDSDNDGLFSDESFITINNTNLTNITYKVNKVGRYLFELEVKENFGQPTIISFVTDSDYKRGNTTSKPQADKTTDVKNIAPVTTFTATVKPKVDIIFSQGFLTDYTTRFPNMVNSLEPIVGNQLSSRNIDYSFYNTSVWNPNNLYEVITSTAPVSTTHNTWFYDLGKTVNKSDIVDIDFWAEGVINSLYFYVSPDNINWYSAGTYTYHVSPIYDGVKTYYVKKSNVPIDSFRYTKIRWTGFYGSQMTYYSQKITINKGGGENFYKEFSSGYIYYSATKTYDLEQSFNCDDIYSMDIFVPNTSMDGANVSVSPNGSAWTCVGYVKWSSLHLLKDVLPSIVRYVKVTWVTGGTSTNCIVNINLARPPRSTLADIQTRTTQSLRTGATRYVVSLAEESYIDAMETSLNNTANLLNQNGTNLIVFSDAGHIASAQQLTSRVTKQRIITTTYNMSVPLDHLADHVVNTVNSGTVQSGFITVLLGETLQYNPSYTDYENDPKNTDNWYYEHDPDYLDNNSGLSLYDKKVLTSPIGTLDKVGKYGVKYNAQDNPSGGDLRFLNYWLWSEPSPTTVIVHRKPVANFSVQAGTLNITDLSYDPDFQFQRPDKGIVEWFWKYKKTSDSNWTVGKPTGITQTGDYNFYLMVKDVYGVWSDPYEKTVTVSSLNKPPVVDFTWTPTSVYEGDNVTTINLTTDPDGNPMTYQWTVFTPAGSTTTYNTTNITLTNVQPGRYWLALRAWDNQGAADVKTKYFDVNPLGINGHIDHTVGWNNKRIYYNQVKTGTDDSPRPYNVFWAGERFMLSADTTNTGSSATKAQTVTSRLLYNGVTASLIPNADKTHWTGEMWREDFQTIPDGPHTFRFTAAYSNGAVKTDDVSIIIAGSWQDYFRFHRSW